MRKKAIEGLKQGDTFTFSRTFTKEDVLLFADITQDYNPVHLDQRFAEIKKLRGPICHGLLVASMITRIGGQIGWFASGMSFRFKKPVYFGDTVTCHLTIAEVDERGRATAEAAYKNQDGVTVLEGALTGIVPGPQEQQVMKTMVAEGDPTNKVR